ncbi:hypothetical protein BD779DRAFT_1678079 [Infundibulicybe gibba]|nr:hypothetical protein BD779DRAFT_1678079 [Infundibulicybe gibba]
MDQRGLSCISVPPKPDGATLAEYPGGWSECLVTDKIKGKILSTPGFPAPLARPPKVHRIGSAPGKGPGTFTTHDLDMGGLVHDERPLLILPSCTKRTRIGYPQDWTGEQQCYRAFEHLEPEAQDAFLSLANIHMEDGSWTTHGICRTNGFGIEELVDTIGTFEAPYVRLRPECNSVFRGVRHQDHRKYMFDYNCPACGPDFKISDQNRLDIMAGGNDPDANYTAWLEDEVIKTSRRSIKVIESEGLESLTIHRRHLGAIHRAYVALGDKENAVKYGVLLGKSFKTVGELKPSIMWLSNLRRLQKRPDWAIRTQA